MAQVSTRRPPAANGNPLEPGASPVAHDATAAFVRLLQRLGMPFTCAECKQQPGRIWTAADRYLCSGCVVRLRRLQTKGAPAARREGLQ